jgi:poly(3-hydroxybutyrate) depolymerase
MPEGFDFSRLLGPPGFGWGGAARALGPEDLPTFPSVRLDLATMLLLDAQAKGTGGAPALIVAPYAVHDAGIADMVPGHSLARVLIDNGVGPLALVSWKSATASMRDFGVDAYLSDLNVAVDDLGGRASLIGLCQGGWLAALYAARFPAKVASLALAGAPLDAKAAESGVTRALALTPPALIEGMVAMFGGLVHGGGILTLAPQGIEGEYKAALALQCEPDAALNARFSAWRDRTLTLPGRYFIETAEWLFRENRLAENRFPALGRLCGLGDIEAPVQVLAARDDRIVAPPQALAARERCPRAEVNARLVVGGHLSLFMGRRTLAQHWPRIARWLGNARA